jgi:hypothetical protein
MRLKRIFVKHKNFFSLDTNMFLSVGFGAFIEGRWFCNDTAGQQMMGVIILLVNLISPDMSPRPTTHLINFAVKNHPKGYRV